jgi:hypothetical protein
MRWRLLLGLSLACSAAAYANERGELDQLMPGIGTKVLSRRFVRSFTLASPRGDASPRAAQGPRGWQR